MLEAPPPTALDVSGLAQLKQRAAQKDPAALQEAATQFEALFIGIMLKSARDANLGNGILDNESTKQYLELMDQQVALELARKGGFGLGKMIAGQLAPRDGAPVDGAADGRTGVDAALASGGLRTDTARAPYAPGAPAGARDFPMRLPASLRALAMRGAADTNGETDASGSAAEEPIALGVAGGSTAEDPAADFVRRLLPEATAAAQTLGVEPRVLLAQAALETGWGAATAQRPDGRSANNLFGIKAGTQWHGERDTHWTTEHEGGAARRKLEAFRAYGSSADSFTDYVHLISTSPRYAEALENAGDPEAYARAVKNAGYATDPNYVEKWMSIYRGERLGGALDGLKADDVAPIP